MSTNRIPRASERQRTAMVRRVRFGGKPGLQTDAAARAAEGHTVGERFGDPALGEKLAAPLQRIDATGSSIQFGYLEEAYFFLGFSAQRRFRVFHFISICGFMFQNDWRIELALFMRW